MVGVGNRDVVVGARAGAAPPAHLAATPAPRAGGRIRHDRPLGRRAGRRRRPALARTPLWHAQGISLIPPAAARGHEGASPARSDAVMAMILTLTTSPAAIRSS